MSSVCRKSPKSSDIKSFIVFIFSPLAQKIRSRKNNCREPCPAHRVPMPHDKCGNLIIAAETRPSFRRPSPQGRLADLAKTKRRIFRGRKSRRFVLRRPPCSLCLAGQFEVKPWQVGVPNLPVIPPHFRFAAHRKKGGAATFSSAHQT